MNDGTNGGPVIPVSSQAAPRINAERLWQRVMTLASFSTPDVPWTRRAFTPLFMTARAWLAQEFREAGLETRLDTAGNLIGRRPGRRVDLKPLVSGSHCDTVVGGGRFDGIIGVLAALEIAHCMREDGVSFEHTLEVVDFLSEEPSDYGVSCVGSRAMAGVLTRAMLDQRNPNGETLAAGIDGVGGDSSQLASASRVAGSHAAFVELHIEQGPVLEKRNLPIGVVSNIVGIRRVSILVSGQPDHAGTTPMDIRRDALVGAAELITCAQRLAVLRNGEDGAYVVATIGRIAMTPNVPNAVPGTVEMTLEVRSDRREILCDFPERLLHEASEALNLLRVSASQRELTFAEPTDCSNIVMDAVRQAADDVGLASMTLPSGAGHDAAYMAAIGPMGMVFIPCLGGRSHCPEESITSEQLSMGARVLYQTLMNLDHTLAAG